MRRRRSAAYTLVEMVTVTAILAMMAALIAPNLVALQRSRVLRETEAAILRLPAEARVLAARRREPIAMRVDGDDLILERASVDEAAPGAMGTLDSLPTGADDEQDTLKRVALAGEVRVESAQQGEAAVDPGTWRWVVYPDGSAETGGLILRFGAEQKALYLPVRGAARWADDGELPDPTLERWPAGEVEQRVAT